MSNLEFSVPYNNDIETLDKVLELKRFNRNSIREIYLSGPQKYSGSGRAMGKTELNQFLEVVEKIHKHGVRVNLVLNPTCEGSDWYCSDSMTAKIDYLQRLHEEHGVEAVTIANPIYVKAVRKHLPNIEICASVLSDIDCIQRALVYARAGANVITPDVNINRNLELLKEIKKVTGAELRLMVNEGCLHKCPFRKFHFNYMSHMSKEGLREQEVFLPHCHQIIKEDLSQILKSCWIRPEDITKYSEIAQFFKVVGRELPKSKVVRAVTAYMEESWEGDLLDIVSSSLGSFALKSGFYLDNKIIGECGFFERVTACKQDCNNCSYCQQLADKIVKRIGFTEEKMEDKGLIYMIDDLKEKGIINEVT
jgi:collagenase-like PrtC family protease